MKNNEDIYRRYLDQLRAAIIERYLSQNRKASGKFEEELKGEVGERGFKLFGAAHSRFVEVGRNAGKFPPRKAIEDWIEVKQGLPAIFKENKKQFAFLIARKIHEQGTEGSDVITTPLNEFMEISIPKILNEIGINYAVRFKADATRFIKDLK